MTAMHYGRLAEEAAQRMIDEIEAGTAPWVRQWDPELVPDAPVNTATGKTYRGLNAILLSGRRDPRWCTFKQAKALGAHVWRGEKGTPITYWKLEERRRVRDDAGRPLSDAQGKPLYDVHSLARPIPCRAIVFNASQMDGLPAYEPPPARDADEVNARIRQVLEHSTVAVRHGVGHPRYTPGLDVITLPPMEAFNNDITYHETLLHEFGHSTGHATRLNRDFTGKFGTPDYAREELRAELASFLMAQEFGTGFTPGRHAAYIKSWLRVLREDPKEVFRAGRDAAAIVRYALEVEKTPEKELMAARSQRDAQQAPSAAPAEAAPAIGDESGDELKVGSVVRLKGPCLDNEPGVVGVVFEVHEGMPGERRAGLSVIFPNGEYDGFASKELDELFEHIAGARDPRVAGYEFRDTKTLWKDFREGRFDGVFKSRDLNGPQARPSTSPEAPAREGGTSPPTAKQPSRLYLDVPYDERERAREAGARWDWKAKRWYAPNEKAAQDLNQWNRGPREPVSEFGEALASAGLRLDGPPTLDGQRHRVPVEGARAGKRDGVYWGYPDDPVSGFFENHRSGERGTWTAGRSSGIHVAPEHVEAQRLAREAERAADQAARSNELREEFHALAPASPGHAYLQRKGIDTAAVRRHVRLDGAALTIPICDATGNFMSVQRVLPGGVKLNAKGATIRGAMARVGTDETRGPIIVATGFSTAAAIHEVTGYTVWAAMSDANLEAAATKLQAIAPARAVVICADDDHARPENPGRSAGEKAAQATGGVLVFPQFKARTAKQTDFCDLLTSEGRDAVGKQIVEAAQRACAQRRQAEMERADPSIERESASMDR